MTAPSRDEVAAAMLDAFRRRGTVAGQPELARAAADVVLALFDGAPEAAPAGAADPLRERIEVLCADTEFPGATRWVWGPSLRAALAAPPAPSSTDAAEGGDIEALIEASSLGTPEAKAARESVAPETARAIVLASRYLGERDAAREEAYDQAFSIVDGLLPPCDSWAAPGTCAEADDQDLWCLPCRIRGALDGSRLSPASAAASSSPVSDPACCCGQITARLVVCPVHPEKDALLAAVEARGADTEFMARIKASVEQHRPILDRLAEDDGPDPVSDPIAVRRGGILMCSVCRDVLRRPEDEPDAVWECPRHGPLVSDPAEAAEGPLADLSIAPDGTANGLTPQGRQIVASMAETAECRCTQEDAPADAPWECPRHGPLAEATQ